MVEVQVCFVELRVAHRWLAVPLRVSLTFLNPQSNLIELALGGGRRTGAKLLCLYLALPQPPFRFYPGLLHSSEQDWETFGS